MKPPTVIEGFLKEVVHWAEGEPEVMAVALVGSYARGQARPDSDIDLVLIVADPARFLKDTAWAGRFGEVQKQQVEDYGMVTSLRVWYADGREVEYGLTTPAWAAPPLDAGTRRVMEDGIQVLYGSIPTVD